MPFQIIRNDITKVKADAIVNTANPEPIFSRGTDGAIYRAAGVKQLLAARRQIGQIPVGEAAVTPAFALDAKYIIHTVGPLWQGGGAGEADAVRNCYRNSLRLAREKDCESIAFPLLSTGSYGFPKGEALQIALSEISDFLTREEMQVWLVVFDEESFGLSGRLFADIDAYIDSHYVEAQMAKEYDAAFAGTETTVLAGAKSEASAQVKQGVSSLPTADRKGIFGKWKKKRTSPVRKQGDEEVQGTGRGQDGIGLPPYPPLAILPPARESAFREDASNYLVDKEKGRKPKPQAKSQSVAKPPSIQCYALGGAVSLGRSLEDVMAQLGETFQQRLFRLIDERSLTDVEVYKRANLDRKLFSKIRCKADYRPKKVTVLALAVALQLNLDETKDLLARAEMALSPSSKFDLIISYFIEREVYDIYAINVALYEHGLPQLGVQDHDDKGHKEKSA